MHTCKVCFYVLGNKKIFPSSFKWERIRERDHNKGGGLTRKLLEPRAPSPPAPSCVWGPPNWHQPTHHPGILWVGVTLIKTPEVSLPSSPHLPSHTTLLLWRPGMLVNSSQNGGWTSSPSGWWQEGKTSNRQGPYGTIWNQPPISTHSGGTHHPHYNGLTTVQRSETWNHSTSTSGNSGAEFPLVPAGL